MGLEGLPKTEPRRKEVAPDAQKIGQVSLRIQLSNHWVLAYPTQSASRSENKLHTFRS